MTLTPEEQQENARIHRWMREAYDRGDFAVAIHHQTMLKICFPIQVADR